MNKQLNVIYSNDINPEEIKRVLANTFPDVEIVLQEAKVNGLIGYTKGRLNSETLETIAKIVTNTNKTIIVVNDFPNTSIYDKPQEIESFTLRNTPYVESAPLICKDSHKRQSAAPANIKHNWKRRK